MSPFPAPTGQPSWFQRTLGLAERIGNRLPDPSTLSAVPAGAVVLLSWEFAQPAPILPAP